MSGGEFFAKEYNSCNLGSINLYNFVKDPFTDNAGIDWERLSTTVKLAVTALDEILDYGYDLQPLDKNREDIENYRSIGLGVFGLADALIALGIRYEDSAQQVGDIMKFIFKNALITSANLAKEKGTFKKYTEKLLDGKIFSEIEDEELITLLNENGLRNSTLLSIAPTGSISTMCGLSGGIEPLFQVAYQRTTHSLVNEGKYFEVFAKSVSDMLIHKNVIIEPGMTDKIKLMYSFVVDSHDINPKKRVDVQAAIQRYVDNAISSTINMKKGTTTEEIMDTYIYAWEQGCKGLTIFVDGCERTAIMGNSTPTAANLMEDPAWIPGENTIFFDSIKPVKREEVAKDEEGLLGKSYRGSTACVPKLYTQVNEIDGNIFEVFTNTSQGCTSNINTITRLASLALRSGVKVTEIVKELKGSNCSACLDRKKSGKKVSNSCGACIGEAIEKYYNEKAKVTGTVIANSEPKVVEETAEEAISERLMPCPECGESTLRPEGKCNTCHNCGYSRCD